MADHSHSLSHVLALIRAGQAVTRPELVRETGWTRAIVLQRVDDLLASGMLRENAESRSTGGRPSPVLEVAADRGRIAAAVFGVTRLHVAITDLAGNIVDDRRLSWPVDAGPAKSMAQLFAIIDELLDAEGRGRLWAAAIGLPGPVDFAGGAAVDPPLMPGWDQIGIRAIAEQELGVPVWIDNDANLMALGAWSRTRQAAGENVLFVKAGTGLGSGLISAGRVHRGARGSAGDFGHVIIAEESRHRCRCGKYGCLEALAGGWALARDATPAAQVGRSAFLKDRLGHSGSGSLDIDDIIRGSVAGDTVSRELVQRAGDLIGTQVSNLVNFFNPSTVFLGGVMTRAGVLFRDVVADAVYRRSLALAVDQLVISTVPLHHYEGAIGAATLALDGIFGPATLPAWLDASSPRGLSANPAIRPDVTDIAARAAAIEAIAEQSRNLS